MRFGFILFILIQILLLPITIIGNIYNTLYVVYKAKKMGISASAVDPLSYRWILHLSGERTDEACVKLLKKLPVVSMTGMRLSSLSVILGMKVTGYIPSIAKYAHPGKETLTKIYVVRTEFFDQALEKHLSELDQVVIMGAGFDTRSYKFLQKVGIKVFEIDMENTQNHKINALKEAGLETDFINFVPVDFNRESWIDKLIDAGFQKGKRSFFLWEGVTLYLSEEIVKHTINSIAEVSGYGSVFAFDVYSLSFVDPNTFVVKIAAKLVEASGEKFGFGIDMSKNPEQQSGKMLKGSGFSVNRIRVIGKPKGSLGHFCCVIEAVKDNKLSN